MTYIINTIFQNDIIPLDRNRVISHPVDPRRVGIHQKSNHYLYSPSVLRSCYHPTRTFPYTFEPGYRSPNIELCRLWDPKRLCSSEITDIV